MTRDTRVGFTAYWGCCSPMRKREIASATGLTVDYLREIASGTKRASRLAAIAIVLASDGCVRPSSLRRDVWAYGAEIQPHQVAAVDAWRKLRVACATGGLA